MRGSKIWLLVNIVFVSSSEATTNWFRSHSDSSEEPYLTNLTLKHKIGQMMQLNIDQILTDSLELDQNKYVSTILHRNANVIVS